MVLNVDAVGETFESMDGDGFELQAFLSPDGSDVACVGTWSEMLASRGAPAQSSAHAMRRFRRLGLAAAALLAAFLFLSSLRKQASELDANRSLEALLGQGRAVRLGEARIVFQRCLSSTGATGGVETCETRGEGTFAFPAASSLEAAIAKLGKPRPNRALVTFPLDESLRQFLAARTQAALVLVRSVQDDTGGARFHGTDAIARGVGQNAVFPFSTARALADGELRLRFDFLGLGWFGPADVPAVLVDLPSVDALTSLPLKLTFASRLSWQLELGFPLLLAATALVLDHSAVFGYACLYAVARAARTWLNMQVADGTLDVFGPEGLFLYAACGLCVPLLLLFARSMSGMHGFRAKYDIPFGLAWLAGFVFVGQKNSDFVMTSDLWSDGLSGLLGVGVLFARLMMRGVVHWVERRGDRTGSRALEQRKPGGSAQRVLRGGGFFSTVVPPLILGIGLALTAAINFSELRAFTGQGFKNPLDWRHMALFPFLLVTALFEVGSTSRRIAEVSREIEEKTRLDDALRIAENIHGRMLPPLRGAWPRGGGWRALYRPAYALGGDWFDVREVVTPEGQRHVVGCVVDLTGHGIGPSLAASALCSQWREWWSRVANETRPLYEKDSEFSEHSENLEISLLGEAALRMHRALSSLSSEETATACFFLVTPSQGRLAYLTCAHPGLLLQDLQSSNVLTLQTRSGGLGAARGRYTAPGDFPVALRSLPPGSSFTLCAFSDGFCLSEAGVSSWSHRLARESQLGRRPVALALAKALRAALHTERATKSSSSLRVSAGASTGFSAGEYDLPEGDVDDKTLLVVTLQTDETRIATSPRGSLT